jgi:pimeloyl-ACP methyl ester carboxylesterase
MQNMLTIHWCWIFLVAISTRQSSSLLFQSASKFVRFHSDGSFLGHRHVLYGGDTHVLRNSLSEHDSSLSTIHESQLTLKSGLQVQVLSCPANHANSLSSSSSLPPIVFIHGSFHAAWCWAEHYLEYFSSLGYPVIAYSLRGTSGSSVAEGVTKIKIEEHVADLQSFLNEGFELIWKQSTALCKPILVAHSFGGLTVMKYLELHPQEIKNLGGVALLCSVPPTGNGPMTMRFLKRSLVDSYKITVGFVLKRCLVRDDLCRELFFGGKKTILPNGNVEDYGISDDDISRYQNYFQRDSKATVDVGALLKSLPAIKDDGTAPFLPLLPPCIVIGASRDFIVDRIGVEETAAYFGLHKPLFVDSPHDVMLGRNWRNGAGAIHSFIQSRNRE